MDHLRGAARGALREVVALDERHRVPARGGVQGDAGAGDAAADHDDVELLALDRLQGLRACDHEDNLVEELDDLLGGRPLGRALLLDRRARGAAGPTKRSSSPRPDRGAALGRAQDARACASSRRARARARPAARCRRRRRPRAGPPRPGRGRPLSTHEQTTRVGARSSLGAASGPAASFSRSSASGPITRKRHGFGQVVVRRPAGELEQLLELARARTGSGA